MDHFEIITHTVVAIALIMAYVAVTIIGDDGNTVLGILAGYIGGAGIGNSFANRRINSVGK